MKVHGLSVFACIAALTAFGPLARTDTLLAPDPAPTGFSDETNGVADQATHDEDREVFGEVELIADGLGPVYNAQSCRECHQNPVSGGISQVTELRAGHFDGQSFLDHPGNSLINDRAIDAGIQEHVLGGTRSAPCGLRSTCSAMVSSRRSPTPP